MTGKIFSRFRIIDRIGEGGMGIVYRAEDTRMPVNEALRLATEMAERLAGPTGRT